MMGAPGTATQVGVPAALPEMSSVSVIIVTYNALAFIEDCLLSVFSQSYPNVEVIVVDNASTDGTADLVAKEYPLARLIRCSENRGYGAGNNRGASVATGQTLVFLNPDTIARPDWLKNLLFGMRLNKSRLATSKIVLRADPSRLNTCGKDIHFLGLSYCRGLNSSESTYQHPELLSGFSGAAFAISRDLFFETGGFDETFFLYHDDVDLSLRALLAGEQSLYVPDSVVVHDYELKVPARKWGWVEAYRYAILLKVFRLRTLLLLLPALLLMDMLTFAYLFTRGPTYVLAKLAGYLWVARHWQDLLRSRELAQRSRRLSDRQLLALLGDRIPYEQLAPQPISMVGNGVIDPLFGLHRRLSLQTIHW